MKDDKLKKCLEEVKKMPKDEVKKQFKKSWNKFKGKKYKELKFEDEKIKMLGEKNGKNIN